MPPLSLPYHSSFPLSIRLLFMFLHLLRHGLQRLLDTDESLCSDPMERVPRRSDERGHVRERSCGRGYVLCTLPFLFFNQSLLYHSVRFCSQAFIPILSTLLRLLLELTTTDECICADENPNHPYQSFLREVSRILRDKCRQKLQLSSSHKIVSLCLSGPGSGMFTWVWLGYWT